PPGLRLPARAPADHPAGHGPPRPDGPPVRDAGRGDLRPLHPAVRARRPARQHARGGGTPPGQRLPHQPAVHRPGPRRDVGLARVEDGGAGVVGDRRAGRLSHVPGSDLSPPMDRLEPRLRAIAPRVVDVTLAAILLVIGLAQAWPGYVPIPERWSRVDWIAYVLAFVLGGGIAGVMLLRARQTS